LLDFFGQINCYSQKNDQSNIVTEADLAIENFILKELKNKFPSHNFLAEESGFINNNSNYTWIIDPLDGTSNFASRIPWFGIIVTLLKNENPLLVGIKLPMQNELYWGIEGKGAFLNGNRIFVSNETDLKNVLFSYCIDFSLDVDKTNYETRIIGKLVQKIRNLRCTNSVTDFCYVADGRLGGCINQTTKIWDIAGPYLLIKEAGGIITDHVGNKIKFSLCEDTYAKNYTIMATNLHFFPILKEITLSSLA